jgi:hypothetical protein
MATIKSYTDIEQSRKLAEIIPIESADYYHATDIGVVVTTPYITYCGEERCVPAYKGAVPCWSLSALLSVVSNYCRRLEITTRIDKKYNVFALKNNFVFRSFDECPGGYDNLVNSCYEIILKLHELNLL